jgi:D-alanyl-lipoteichoic acid acyltransferase DltB (MBOAT superfamily)
MENIFKYSFDKPWFFTNLSFLGALGIFLMIYSLLLDKPVVKKLFLILFSLFFYYKSSGPYLIIFISMIIVDYNVAILIEKITNTLYKKLLLSISIILSLSFLLYFKYAGFFIINFNAIFEGNIDIPKLFLPIGISFYTFQSISYIIDVYNKQIDSTKKFIDYVFYMTFFPHLVAGPIVRARDFIYQIDSPLQIDKDVFKESLFRIVLGLGKKLLIADYLAKYVDIVHSDPSNYSGLENLISMYVYSFQIYFDFSGYSDIAIGIALILGYKLKENFDHPYLAENITSFWRKWHMSLSSWLRDYLYIPMGGNRKGVFKTYLFLLITMTVGGFWHGAKWTFIIWGILHGIGLMVHKLIGKYKFVKFFSNRAVNIFITFNYISLLWIFFRSTNTTTAIESLNKIFFHTDYTQIVGFYLARKEVILFLVISSIIIFFINYFKEIIIRFYYKVPIYVTLVFIIIFFQIIIQVKDNIVEPFIYFQF